MTTLVNLHNMITYRTVGMLVVNIEGAIYLTRENIVLAALRLFLHRGYSTVSVIDIANEIGITKGGIYHYFSSKDQLLQVALHYLLDRFEAKYVELLNSREPVREMVGRLLVDRPLESYARELLQVQPERDLDYAHFAIDVMRQFPDIQARIEQSYMVICQVLCNRLETARKEGELHPGADCFALAVAIISIVHGQNSLGCSFQTQAMRQQVSAEMLRLMENKMCALAASAAKDNNLLSV